MIYKKKDLIKIDHPKFHKDDIFEVTEVNQKFDGYTVSVFNSRNKDEKYEVSPQFIKKI